MTSAMQPSSRRPAGRGFLLLVLAVLAGVLAMHGLGPGSDTAKQPTVAGSHPMVPAHESAGHQIVGDCSHGDDGASHHADATCAATGIGVPYSPPALAATLDAVPVTEALPGSAAGTPERGRAPPDLAELQLLRI
ncbi:DUF6153 family protein [Streptomyces sp. NPDC002908]|uniref:DUF6153 family protein n=1 Tax=Streptomyces sp. NPDC002908 TaxID=3364670 RepID=UPI0036C6A755